MSAAMFKATTHGFPMLSSSKIIPNVSMKSCRNQNNPAYFAGKRSLSLFASQQPLTCSNLHVLHRRKESGSFQYFGLKKNCSSVSTVPKATDGDENGSRTKSNSALEDPPSWYREDSPEEESDSPIQKWLYPSKDELPDDVEMSIWDHLEELRSRVLISVAGVGATISLCFFFVKDLVNFLEAPVYAQGVRFLQLSPGEYFFTTLKVAGYSGLLLGSPIILYEIVAFVIPGLTLSERKFLSPIVFGSSILFYAGVAFSYKVLTPAALNFFISYAEGVVESFWSIDQYFEFVLVLMFSTGISFQVPVIQMLLGSTGLVSSQQMLSIWRYVVVGAVVAAAILTPSTDPLTQILLAGPLIGLYMGGAYAVKAVEATRSN